MAVFVGSELKLCWNLFPSFASQVIGDRSNTHSKRYASFSRAREGLNKDKRTHRQQQQQQQYRPAPIVQMMGTAREGRRSLQGSIITGDDIEDYRTVPPMSLVLSPTPSRPTEADVDLVREVVRQTVLDGLRAEAGTGADDVDVSFDLGEVVELTFVPDDGDGRGGSKLRRRNLASSVASDGTGSTSTSRRRRMQDTPATATPSSPSSAYTIVGFGESQVTYRAPLLSDFAPPSQTAFEEETWVAVADDATAKIPDAIRTAVAASVGGGGSSGSGVLAGLQGATADLAYEPPEQVPGSSSGAAEEVKQEPSETEPEPVEVPEPEPVEEESQPVDETPEVEEDILPAEEEVAQPPDSAMEGSDGETLTIPPPSEEEQTAIVEKEQTDEEEAGAVTEAEPSAPVQEEEKEMDLEPQQEQEQEEDENEQEEQEEQTNILPMPTPEDGEEVEKEEDAVADIPAKGDGEQDTISSPQDSAVPPPLFGGGDYTGDSSVSSVGIAEGGADGTVSRGGGAGGDGPAIGAIVGGCMAALLVVLFIAAMFVKRRRRRRALEEGGKRTKLQGDVEDGGELGADNTFELDDSGELMLNGMHVEPADGNRSNDANLLSQGDDEGSDEGRTGGSGYLPTGLFGSFVGGNKSARRKASPKSVVSSMNEENSDEEDSVLTDWSGAPSVNSLGHSVQGSIGDDEPTSVTNDLAKTYDLSNKSRSGGANVLLQFQKKKERKRSKSMDLYGQQPNVRTEEDFERQRNAASISLRKDMMCTVDSMSAYPMHGRSRSADHGLLAPGTSLGTSSPEAPEAAWIWGSRNEADMRPKNGGGQELQML